MFYGLPSFSKRKAACIALDSGAGIQSLFCLEGFDTEASSKNSYIYTGINVLKNCSVVSRLFFGWT